MLRRLEVSGVVGCLLAPGHAGEVAAALNRLRPNQAVIVVQPVLRTLRILMQCEDLSADIASHRLWFAGGEGWSAALEAIFVEHPGLPTPEQFIRTPALDEAVSGQLIPRAEEVIARQNAARAAKLAQIRCELENPVQADSSRPRRVCMVARSHFRLWDDAGHALSRLMRTVAGADVVSVDPDDPVSAAPLALALAARETDAVFTTDLGRSQLPPVIASRQPVTTWITKPTIPTFDARFPADSLMLADVGWESTARAAGWPNDRLRVAAWPGATQPSAKPPVTAAVGILLDIQPLETPRSELALSSHHLLWESIRAELLDDPFRLGADVRRFLDARRQKMGIAEEGFAADWFVERLVLPAYAQGLACSVSRAGLPLALYGKGWDAIEEFRQVFIGRLDTREQFERATAACDVLVYPWPVRYAHQIDALGKRVINPGRNERTFWRDLKAAANVT